MSETYAPAPPGWEALLTDAGQSTLTRIGEALRAGESTATLNASLRRDGVPADEVAAFLTQAQLRRKAVGKFGDLAEQLLFTAAGLEQATRQRVAKLHAARFAAAGCKSVADLGCGIGAESMALLAKGVAPHAVELDPFTARLAEHNLSVVAAAHGAPAAAPRVTAGDATLIGPGDADGVFLDPARRTAGHSDTRRIANPDDYSPSLTFAFGFGETKPTGVKLGPGLDRELIPDTCEAQWVSVDGQVVETGLWFGAVARPGIGRSALVLRGDEPAAELTAAQDSDDVDARDLGEYLYEPDGAVIRARLIGSLAGQLGAGMISEQIAYLTADTLTPTPFAQTFRIVEAMSAREKDLKRALAARDIGTLEIKKRGADVDPASLRKRLKLRGSASATLFLTRVAGKHTALLAERV